MPEWMRQSLSDAGSIASLVGLLLTIWVALTVRRLRAFYVFRARVPELARKLRLHASALATHMNDFDAFKERIREELLTAEVTVNSLQRKLSGQSKTATKTLLAEIRRINGADLGVGAVRGVYLQMIHVSEHLKDLQSDLKWER